MIVIRRARETDFDAIARVWMESWQSLRLPHWQEANYDEMRARIPVEIAGGWQLFVADDEGTIAAMLAFRTRDNYLDQIFVGSAYQHSGLGKRLLAVVREHLPDEILLRADTRNAFAIAWYEREGFVRENEVMQDGWDAPRVYYRWKRKPA
ncbi:MAG TPA: GNAT family N-acetyltransferase [Rhizomicrobium sp.]|jgi:ribosomal protein S18 acetylase RimI-like enzyme|nr:GNAT family N-acetyltransferase [Rhizomicrobium sp.]